MMMVYLVDLILIGFSIGVVYALVALGISFIYSGLDILHFAHPEFYMAGAYIGFVLVTAGVPFPLAVIISMVLTGVLGVLVERVFYRKLTAGGGGLTVAGMGIIICGFGIAIVMQNIAYLIFSATPKALPYDFGPPLAVGHIDMPRGYFWIVAVAIALVAMMTSFLNGTRIGLAVRAVAHSKTSAALMGINTPMYISLIFGVGCALAAAAGVLASSVNFLTVQMGYVIGIKAFAAAVIGGLGSLPGAIVGGVIIGLTEALGAGYLSAEYKDVYPFFILILVLLIRPSGILGIRVKEKA
jgi:branched-chain amino acid transport system permease protein